MGSQKGFTLIEMIASIVLIGILGAFASFGLAKGMEAYLFAQQSSDMLQKAQFTLNRLKMELINMDEIESVSANSISYRINTRDSELVTIERSGNEISITRGASGPHPIGESFTNLFQFRNTEGGAWTTADDIADLRYIDITIALKGLLNSGEFDYTTRVVPRGIPVDSGGQHNAPSRFDSE